MKARHLAVVLAVGGYENKVEGQSRGRDLGIHVPNRTPEAVEVGSKLPKLVSARVIELEHGEGGEHFILDAFEPPAWGKGAVSNREQFRNHQQTGELLLCRHAGQPPEVLGIRPPTQSFGDGIGVEKIGQSSVQVWEGPLRLAVELVQGQGQVLTVVPAMNQTEQSILGASGQQSGQLSDLLDSDQGSDRLTVTGYDKHATLLDLTQGSSPVRSCRGGGQGVLSHLGHIVQDIPENWSVSKACSP